MRHHHQLLIDRGYKVSSATRYRIDNNVAVQYVYDGKHGNKPLTRNDGTIDNDPIIWMTPVTAAKHGIVINHDNR